MRTLVTWFYVKGLVGVVNALPFKNTMVAVIHKREAG